jgi:hypothetical protein
MTPSGIRGVLNYAVSIYFADATLASAFVARWCVGSKVETAGGLFQLREDEPAPRVGVGLHRTRVKAVQAQFGTLTGEADRLRRRGQCQPGSSASWTPRRNSGRWTSRGPTPAPAPGG